MENNFFRELEMFAPGMESVRENYKAGDYKKAAEEYRNYLSRKLKNINIDTSVFFDENDSFMKDADMLLLNKLSLLDMDYIDIGSPVNWFITPGGDKQWQSHLAYMYFPRCLIYAYFKTNEEKYIIKFREIVEDFIDNHPLGVEGLEYHTARPMYLAEYKYKCGGEGQFPGYLGGSWIALAASARVDHWITYLKVLIDDKNISTEFILKMIDSIAIDHAYIMINNARRYTPNQFFDVALNLVKISIVFSELRIAPSCYLTGMQRLEESFARCVLPDGSDLEQSFNYNTGIPNKFFELYRIYGENRTERFENLLSSVIRRCEFLSGIRNHMNEWPDIAKTHTCNALKHIEKFEKNYNISLPLKNETVFYPYGGFYVLKNDSTYVLFKASRKAIGHAHEDCNSLVLSAFGENLLIDNGNYNYSDDEDSMKINDYLTSSMAHNTVSVDGFSQNRLPFQANDRKYLDSLKEPISLIHYTSENFDVVQGEYNDGYGDAMKHISRGTHYSGKPQENHIHVKHSRKIIFIKDISLFIVADDFENYDTWEHKYNFSWNLDDKFKPEDIDVSENSIVTSAKGVNIEIHSLFDINYELFYGGEDMQKGYRALEYGILEKSAHIEGSAKESEKSYITIVNPYLKEDEKINIIKTESGYEIKKADTSVRLSVSDAIELNCGGKNLKIKGGKAEEIK